MLRRVVLPDEVPPETRMLSRLRTAARRYCSTSAVAVTLATGSGSAPGWTSARPPASRIVQQPLSSASNTTVAVELAIRGDSVLLVQRAGGERLMSGMWELPRVDSPAHDREILFTVRHSITVTNYLVSVVVRPGAANLKGKWIKKSKLDRLALTGLTKKILRKANIIEERGPHVARTQEPVRRKTNGSSGSRGTRPAI